MKKNHCNYIFTEYCVTLYFQICEISFYLLPWSILVAIGLIAILVQQFDFKSFWWASWCIINRFTRLLWNQIQIFQTNWQQFELGFTCLNNGTKFNKNSLNAKKYLEKNKWDKQKQTWTIWYAAKNASSMVSPQHKAPWLVSSKTFDIGPKLRINFSFSSGSFKLPVYVCVAISPRTAASSESGNKPALSDDTATTGLQPM